MSHEDSERLGSLVVADSRGLVAKTNTLAKRGRELAEALLAHQSTSGQAEAPASIRAAAEAGEAKAQVTLGMMYAKGDGVQQDYVEAVKWFRRAAGRGYSIAEAKLGWLYIKGLGVAEDHVEAYKWLHLASSHASRKNQITITRVRAELAKQMTSTQIADAQQRARKWTQAFEREPMNGGGQHDHDEELGMYWYP
jgi:TPR repeat protein